MHNDQNDVKLEITNIDDYAFKRTMNESQIVKEYRKRKKGQFVCTMMEEYLPSSIVDIVINYECKDVNFTDCNYVFNNVTDAHGIIKTQSEKYWNPKIFLSDNVIYVIHRLRNKLIMFVYCTVIKKLIHKVDFISHYPDGKLIDIDYSTCFALGKKKMEINTLKYCLFVLVLNFIVLVEYLHSIQTTEIFYTISARI